MKQPFINRDGTAESRTMVYPTTPGSYFMSGERRLPVKRDDGLHTYPDIDSQFLNEIQTLARSNPRMLPLENFQLWGQHAWKAEHGTVEAAQRFGDKLIEESSELTKALIDYINCPTDQTRHMAISEAGDVLWSLVAGASNAGVSIEYAIQNRLTDTARGTLLQTTDGFQYPAWRDKAVEIGMSNLKPISVADIDELFDQGYVPEASTAMNLQTDFYDPEYVEEVLSEWSIDTAYALVLAHIMDTQLQGNIRSPYDQGRADVNEGAAYLFLRTIYTIRAVTDARLSDVWPVNFEKVTARVASGRIDHEDGERSADLQ